MESIIRDNKSEFDFTSSSTSLPTSVSDAVSVIQVRGVSKQYGAVSAVKHVDLTVKQGEIFGLIGHNGAGKSTLFKMLLGLVTPTTGDLLINGQSVQGKHFRQVRRQIGYLPENIVLYDNLSGQETLQFFAKLKGLRTDNIALRCQEKLEQVGLIHAGNRPVRDYSKGMRQRLGFAQALLGQPQVLFLDEPTNGLDPQAIRDFYTILNELKKTGVTILITSHILAELQERVDRLAIMAAGQIQALGSIEQLREKAHLPLSMRITLQAHHVSTVQAQLATFIAQGVTSQVTAYGLNVHSPRLSKMQVLEKLMQMSSLVQDIHMQEATLEEVFFGISD
jgi:Cu-processing system ATP-binding protein